MNQYLSVFESVVAIFSVTFNSIFRPTENKKFPATGLSSMWLQAILESCNFFELMTSNYFDHFYIYILIK